MQLRSLPRVSPRRRPRDERAARCRLTPTSANRRPDRGVDRHRDPAAEGLAQAGTGGEGLPAVGGRPERVAGTDQGRRNRPPAPDRADFREKGQTRRRTGGEGVGTERIGSRSVGRKCADPGAAVPEVVPAGARRGAGGLSGRVMARRGGAVRRAFPGRERHRRGAIRRADRRYGGDLGSAGRVLRPTTPAGSSITTCIITRGRGSIRRT